MKKEKVFEVAHVSDLEKLPAGSLDWTHCAWDLNITYHAPDGSHTVISGSGGPTLKHALNSLKCFIESATKEHGVWPHNKAASAEITK